MESYILLLQPFYSLYWCSSTFVKLQTVWSCICWTLSWLQRVFLARRLFKGCQLVSLQAMIFIIFRAKTFVHFIVLSILKVKWEHICFELMCIIWPTSCKKVPLDICEKYRPAPASDQGLHLLTLVTSIAHIFLAVQTIWLCIAVFNIV